MWPWRSSAAVRPSGGLGREPLRLFDRLLDRSDHVEGRLRQVVVLAFDDAFEALDRVRDLDLNAGRAGENGRDVERLRQEALDLAGARDDLLVLLGKLVHAENGDDVLQGLITLQHL